MTTILINGIPLEVSEEAAGAIHFDPAPSIEQLAANKSAEIDADFTAACDAIRAGYTADEIQSWPQQQAQAEAYQANSAAAVPLLNAMATARGITVAELATRILANTSAYSTVYGQALGIKQARQDALSAIQLGDQDAADQIEAV